MSAINGANGRESIRKPNPPVEDSLFKSFRLDGRTVIITGGCGGIGYEIARGLAEAGANLALWYHSSTTHQKIQNKISQNFGVKVETYQVDVRKYAEVEATVAQVVKDFGQLDVMIANAGIPTKAGGLDDKVEDWDNVRATDFDGAYYCMRAAGLVFREQKRGVGIITASMSGHAANVPQEQSCYNACKAGCIHLYLASDASSYTTGADFIVDGGYTAR